MRPGKRSYPSCHLRDPQLVGLLTTIGEFSKAFSGSRAPVRPGGKSPPVLVPGRRSTVVIAVGATKGSGHVSSPPCIRSRSETNRHES
jgi:hypothetical protein